MIKNVSVRNYITTFMKGTVKEVFGLIVLFITLFLSVSLITYSAKDPTVFTVFSSNYETIKNSGGVVGAMIAHVFLSLFGINSYVLIIFTFILSLMSLFSPLITKKVVRTIGFLLLLIFVSVLFDLLFKTVTIQGSSIAAGGVIGAYSAKGLVTLFSKLGAYIISIMFFCVGFLLFTQISLVKILELLRIVFRKAGVLFYEHVLLELYEYGSTQFKNYKLKRKIVEKIDEKESGPKISMGKEEVKEKKKRVQEPVKEERKEVTKVGPLLNGQKYIFPKLEFLDDPPKDRERISEALLYENAKILENKLRDFGILGKVVDVKPGPLVTMYEFEPEAGIKVKGILALEDDLAMALKAMSIRIIAPIPGKAVVGIEVSNQVRELVYLKEVISQDVLGSQSFTLPLAFGKDIAGEVVVEDLKKMPHLLVAGATGTGKSVFLNSIISGLLYKVHPDHVKFLMIDPKILELSNYDGIPHLLLPVVTNPKKASLALMWAIREMENRYKLIAELGVRNLETYNERVEKLKEEKAKSISATHASPENEGQDGLSKPLERLPYIVIIIDEFADLIMVASKQVEDYITRLAQMARAAGIHLIITTQRPSTDVITGLIKANFPARLSFKVTSKYDSRTIIDTVGAEHLLDRGDMLYLVPGTSKMKRIHAPMTTDREVNRLVAFLRTQGMPKYSMDILKPQEETQDKDPEDTDEVYDQAVQIVSDIGKASVSLLQRRLRIGYNRAARIIEKMEEEGIVGPTDGIKPRDVLINRQL